MTTTVLHLARKEQSTKRFYRYDKIADVLDKRGSQAQYAALKGYLKEQGVSADEMDKAIKEFKDKKEADKQSKEKEQADMLAENQSIKATDSKH